MLVAGIVIFRPSQDDLSRYEYIYLIKHKSETYEKFIEFQSEVENHRNKKIKFLRSDRGDEYLSYEFGLQLKTMWNSFTAHATWNTTMLWCVRTS